MMHDSSSNPRDRPVTLQTLRQMTERGEPFACLTCYDATTARHLDAADIEVLLVGDTASEMVLGHHSTIHAPLDFMIQLTGGVRRGADHALVMADMPFMSWQTSPEDGLRNAARFLTEAHADLVKIEVDDQDLDFIQHAAHAGIPVVAHLGARPQQVKLHGGYRAAARTARDAHALLETARRMEDAGCVMLLLEALPDAVSAAVVEQAAIPVIGCGAGPAPHGQVLVLQDVLGLTDWQPPFAPPLTDLATPLRHAAAEWRRHVRERTVASNTFRLADPEQWKPKPLAR